MAYGCNKNMGRDYSIGTAGNAFGLSGSPEGITEPGFVEAFGAPFVHHRVRVSKKIF
jgi:ATP-dependent phosphoenolpyruvate carboxykinase